MTDTFNWGAALPILRGTQVELGPVQLDDAAALLAIFGDREVVRYWSSPALSELSEAQALVADIHAHFARRSLFQWAIRQRGEAQLIGTCTLLNIDSHHQRAELGIALARRVWGQGLASDALATLIRFAFGPLGLHRLEADIDPHNASSLRLFERQGFQREGLLRERWWHDGEYQDAVFLGLLASRRPDLDGSV